MTSKISAVILADSINEHGNRITTFDLTFPRFILAELATHRVFSMNSASSRAIPFKKMKEMVMGNPFIPIAWQKDHKGMQGKEYFTSVDDIHRNERKWLAARTYAVNSAKYLNMGFPEDEKGIGVTKQLCNRLLEPFMWHSVILTGTDFENFFNLRIHPDAEIHIYELAKCMKEAMSNNKPTLLLEGEWHVPYGDNIDYEKLGASTTEYYERNPNEEVKIDMWVSKIVVARCARKSYQTLGDNPKIDYDADIRLHDRLLVERHASPFEHASICRGNKRYANYQGWESYRHTLGL